MKTKWFIRVSRAVIAAGLCSAAVTASAQIPADTTAQLPDNITGFAVDLAKNYPWIATALLVIGALRVVFKPVMSLLDEYVKANCSPEEYGRLQHFEAGPVYKWLSFGFDLLGSVKLPVVGIKPAQSNKD